MTDELEELLEQFSPEEREPDLLDWLEVPATVSRGEKARQSASGKADEADKSAETAEVKVTLPQQAGETVSDGQTAAETSDKTAERIAGEQAELDDADVNLLRAERQAGTLTDETARAASWESGDSGAGVQSGNRESEAADQTSERLAGELEGLTRQELGQSAEALYRQVARAGYLTGSTGGRSGRTVVTQQVTTGAPSLTADELDRAVRRDSRRYDGGMELY